MTSLNSIRTLSACVVVGLRARVRPMSPQIPKLWDDFLRRMNEIAYRAESDVSLGVMGHWDQQLNQFDYQAGVVVNDARSVPSGMVRWEIPGGEYAVFDATLATIGDVFESVPTALYERGYEQIDGPTVERYGPDFAQPQQPLQVWVPVQRRQTGRQR
jgi:predicted transcriptional regulator YdeE